MNKKILGFSVSLCLLVSIVPKNIVSAFTFEGKNNLKLITSSSLIRPTEKVSSNMDSFELDLSDIDLKITDNSIIINDHPGKLDQRLYSTKSTLDANSLKNISAKKEFTKSMLKKHEQDKSFRESLKATLDNLKVNGNDVISIAATKFYDVVKGSDKPQYTDISSILQSPSNILVPKGGPNYSIDGPTRYNPDSSAWVYVSISYTGGGYELWEQSNLYWSSCPAAGGRDFISVAWGSNWLVRTGSDAFTPVMNANVSSYYVQPMCALTTDHSHVYSFNDTIGGSGYIWYTRGVYYGARLFNGPSGYQSFKTEYVHTYSVLNYTATYTGTGYSIGATPGYGQYTVTSEMAPLIILGSPTSV